MLVVWFNLILLYPCAGGSPIDRLHGCVLIKSLFQQNWWFLCIKIRFLFVFVNKSLASGRQQ